MPDITVNGEPQSTTAASIAELLEAQGLKLGAKGLAVAINGRVVGRNDWRETALEEGDEVEIVKPAQGG